MVRTLLAVAIVAVVGCGDSFVTVLPPGDSNSTSSSTTSGDGTTGTTTGSMTTDNMTSGGTSSGAGGAGGSTASGGCAGATSASAELSASADAAFTGAVPNGNFGSAGVLKVWRNGADSRRSVVAFDLSLPAGAQVDTAELCLHLQLQAPTNYQVDVHRLLAAFSEQDVSWNQWEQGQSWAQPGGDFTPNPSASLQVLAATPANTMLCWDVTSDVAAIHDGSLPGYGWLTKDSLEPAQSVMGELNFHSDESSQMSQRPALKVAYTVCP